MDSTVNKSLHLELNKTDLDAFLKFKADMD
jgi:hypothetical protein